MSNIDFGKTIKTIFDYIFSFWTFAFLVVAGFAYVLTTVAENESTDREARRVATELCYNQGMVVVQTDAGPRCADPKGLLKLK